MKLRRAPAPPAAVLFVIPAVQIPLLVLFFVLLSPSFLLQPGLAVSVPTSPFVLSPRAEPLVVAVPPPPATQIFFDGHATDLAGLKESLSNLRGKPRTVVVRADRSSPYEQVAEVLNAALEMGFPTVLASAKESSGEP